MTEPSVPLVSVIIPTFDRAAVIERSVRSALDQKLRALEVIVVDDGSTDPTLDLLRAIDDPRLVVMHGDHRGAPAARNRGIRQARGSWLLFLDSDDLLGPQHLESLLGDGDGPEAIPSEVGAVYTGFTIIDQDGRHGRRCRPRSVVDLTRAFGYENVIGALGAVVLRASVVRSIGGWDESLLARQDIDLLLRASQITRFAVAADRVDTYFVTHASADRISADPRRRRDGFEQFYAKHRHALPLRNRVFLSKRLVRFGVDTRSPSTTLRHLPLGLAGVVARVRVPSDL